MEKKINVIIVDDHKTYRAGLASLLSNFQIDASEEAENGRDLLEQVEAGSVKSKIVLLDVEMPELDGGKTLDFLKKNYPDLKVIMYDSI